MPGIISSKASLKSTIHSPCRCAISPAPFCNTYCCQPCLQADDVPGIIGSKAGLKYTGKDVDAMRSVAKAYQNRPLQALRVGVAHKC